MMRYELTDYEWAAITPMLPNEPRGVSRETIVVFSMAFSGSCGL
jgi:transposase